MLNEKQLIDNGNGVVDCSRFVDCCGFYLHKTCAEAPLELNHPFHRHHPLANFQHARVCDFCDETYEKFIYHWSCGLNFHIKCALFTFNIGERNLKELEHVALEDPSFSSKNDSGKLGKCFVYWEPLAIYTYFSLDCEFNLHKKCAELPLKLNNLCHRKHPLVLQFNNERLSCKTCQVTPERGFVYGCSPCKLVIHIDHALPLPVIEDKSHQSFIDCMLFYISMHNFSSNCIIVCCIVLKRIPFICDACGTEGHHVAYTCGTCNIMVHKKCISLPCIIQHTLHVHRIFHMYFILKEYFESLNCMMCHEVVDIELSSYFCTCNVIFHYCIVSQKTRDKPVKSITKVLEMNDAEEATVIEHCKHKHHLMLSDNIREHGDKCCDGCLLLISAKFYHCSRCDFFLHKSCAELPKMKLFSKHFLLRNAIFFGSKPFILTSDDIFKCVECGVLSNGFSYKCNECGNHMCLRCFALFLQDAVKITGHKHPILFYYGYEEQLVCSATNYTKHKCDDHILRLTYDKINDYANICEEKRDPKHWFYHCETCEQITFNYEDHPHPLTFIKKIHYYPERNKCGKPCDDISIECVESKCKSIAHWECC
ncbi:hypothetical protein V6Z11_A13G005700 [Gossypium hirsutum]